MRAVVQRVTSASVRVGDRTVGAIEQGLLVLVGVEHNDDPSDVQYVVGKVRDMRVFEDAGTPARHMDRSVQDVNGAVRLCRGS
jgi:D-tyrosyl-tRNA(Tyr) deacylase